MRKQFAIVLCVVLLCAMFTGCSKEVAVDAAGLTQITFSGNTTAMTEKDYTATLIPAEHYDLPKTVTVTVDGAVLTEGYTYDPSTGKLTVTGDALTGALTISGTATESIVGKWETSQDVSAMFNAMVTKSDPSTAQYFTFTGLTLDLTMEFTADGTCVQSVSEESYAAFIQAVTEGTVAGMNKMLEDMLKDQNINMTVEEFLAFTGVSMEDMIQQAMGSTSTDSFYAMLVTACNYKVEDGKLYTSASAESKDYTEVNAYTVKDGVLTIESNPDNASEAEFGQYIFPTSLKRVA